ncbi:hypothetical protein Tco_0184347 [Tanacetum coccineum]
MEDGIFFNQSKYIKEMIKKFGLEDSKLMKTPMSSDTKLTKDEECASVDSSKYRGMIDDGVLLTLPIFIEFLSPSKHKFRWGIMRSTGIKRYIDPISGCKIRRTNRKCRIPIDLHPCKVEERMTMKKVGDQMIGVIWRRRIDKEGNVSRFQEYHTSDEEGRELCEHPPYNKYGFVDHTHKLPRERPKEPVHIIIPP